MILKCALISPNSLDFNSLNALYLIHFNQDIECTLAKSINKLINSFYFFVLKYYYRSRSVNLENNIYYNSVISTSTKYHSIIDGINTKSNWFIRRKELASLQDICKAKP